MKKISKELLRLVLSKLNEVECKTMKKLDYQKIEQQLEQIKKMIVLEASSEKREELLAKLEDCYFEIATIIIEDDVEFVLREGYKYDD